LKLGCRKEYLHPDFSFIPFNACSIPFHACYLGRRKRKGKKLFHACYLYVEEKGKENKRNSCAREATSNSKGTSRRKRVERPKHHTAH
jgi:hypothetical protein